MNKGSLTEDSYTANAEQYVSELFQRYCNKTFVFHNIDHTRDVAKRSAEIARRSGLSKHLEILVTVAAWFHDTGYLFVPPKIHEQKSTEIMKVWAEARSVPAGMINGIASCIMSTKSPVQPQNLLQEIICDADTYHLGTPVFQVSDEAVFEELRFQDSGLSRIGFEKSSLSMIRKHQYFTAYCRKLLNEGKEKNIVYLENKYGL